MIRTCRAELLHEIQSGVRFWGYAEAGELLGVMGIQDVQDVTLIRHAYVRTAKRGQGIGGKLLAALREDQSPDPDRHLGCRDLGDPLLPTAWIRLVTPAEKDRLLKEYWSIPARQVETSVVLVEGQGGPQCHTSG